MIANNQKDIQNHFSQTTQPVSNLLSKAFLPFFLLKQIPITCKKMHFKTFIEGLDKILSDELSRNLIPKTRRLKTITSKSLSDNEVAIRKNMIVKASQIAQQDFQLEELIIIDYLMFQQQILLVHLM